MDLPIVKPTELKTDNIAMSVPTAYIKGVDATWIVGELAAGRQVQVKLVVHNRTGHYPQAHNVLGKITGSTCPDECVYVTAHFDHWFAAACDDCAGVGSLFGVAKAFVESSVRPRRTVVFAVFDAEEQGGHADTWYDWVVGSYSHAVATLRPDGGMGPPLHPELPGRVTAMLNLDIIGARGSEVFVETSPELTSLMLRAAEDAGVTAAAVTHVYWPPGSYDDVSFFIAGIPVMQIAWFGPAYDPLYHTSDDTLDKIEPANLHANTAFTVLGAARLAEATVLPYDLREHLHVAEASMQGLLALHPDMEGSAESRLGELREAMERYRAAVDGFEKETAARELSDAEVSVANRMVMHTAAAMGTTLYHWDCRSTPGWDNITLFDTCAPDLKWLLAAVAHLGAGDAAAAAGDLEHMTTMGWGKDVGAQAYADVRATTLEPGHPLWGGPFIPFVPDVHGEYLSLMGRAGGERVTEQSVLASLREKARALAAHVGELAAEAAVAFDRAALALSAE
jgi:hypothetical protein